jgi:hypothetical protein
MVIKVLQKKRFRTDEAENRHAKLSYGMSIFFIVWVAFGFP